MDVLAVVEAEWDFSTSNVSWKKEDLAAFVDIYQVSAQGR